MKITSLWGLEILDSRGKPTVRAFVSLEDGSVHSASVPSGASTGSHEAVELRDNDPSRHLGQGVQKAVDTINGTIQNTIQGMSCAKPDHIDRALIQQDGTDTKSSLGANAILAVSLAVTRAAAYAEKKPLWQYIHDYYFPSVSRSFPKLMVNVVNGGKHAGWNFDIQEFMIIPHPTEPSVSVRMAAEIFHALGAALRKNNLSTLVGDEGGYSPALPSNEAVLDAITAAAQTVGYTRGTDYVFGLDCAASEWFADGMYVSHKDGSKKTAKELTDYYADLGQRYTIQSFEDPFFEDDWDSFTRFTSLARQFHFDVVGDDLFVTNRQRVKKGIELQAATAVLVKVNQIGTVWETVQTITAAKQAGWKTIISHRSGETEDTFIADLAVGSGAEMIKTGSMSRSERLAKYNRLLEIEQSL